MEIKYLININDGRIVDRNQETDKHPNLRPIPDEVVAMIMRGEVSRDDVISAVSVKFKESGEFNIDKYIEDMKTLNVSNAKIPKAPEREKLAEREDVVTIEDISDAMENAKKAKTVKKERAKKILGALGE